MPEKFALVTGGGQRLGRAAAVALAEDGFSVAVHYSSSSEGAAETAKMIADLGRNSVVVRADLADEKQTQRLLADAASRLGGPISVLINNAAAFEPDQFHSATRESWDKHMNVNLRAPFVLTQALAAQDLGAELDGNGEPLAMGHVINLADHWAFQLEPDFTSYAISKMGVKAMTEAAARALAGKVRVNAIGPGPTIKGHRQRPEHFQAQRAATVTGRGSNVEDIIAAIRYLLNCQAVTGELLHVDGGLHLGWQNPNA